MNTKNQELFKLLCKLNHKHSFISNLANGEIELIVHLSSKANNIEDHCEVLEQRYISLFKIIKDMFALIKLLEKNNVKLTKDIELLQSHWISRIKSN